MMHQNQMKKRDIKADQKEMKIEPGSDCDE